MKITIWYISKYFSPGLEGTIGSRSWCILKELVSYGANVVAITSNSNHLAPVREMQNCVDETYLNNVRTIWLRTIGFSTAKSFKRILSWLQFEFSLFRLNKSKIQPPNYIIISSPSILSIINGVFLKWKYRAKLVFEVRDIWPLTLVEDGGYSSFNPFILILSLIEWIGYRQADLVVGTMPNLVAHVRTITAREVPVICVPMGVSADMICRRSDTPSEYVLNYLNANYFNVVYAGTIGIANALETMFKAAELLKHHKKIRFVIIGEGSLKRQYVKDYGHLENVIFAPSVKKSQVNSVLRHASVVYFSTKASKVWEYGQSLNKLVDYMLAGKPILASYSGYPSMINEAECGFFVAAGDSTSLAEKVLELSLLSQIELTEIGSRGEKWLLENRNYQKLSRYLFDELKALHGLR